MRFEISQGLVLVEKEVYSFSVPGYRVIQSGDERYKEGDIVLLRQGVPTQEIPEGNICRPEDIYGKYREDSNNPEALAGNQEGTR